MRDTFLKILTENGLTDDKASVTSDALFELLLTHLPSYEEAEEVASKHYDDSEMEPGYDLQDLYDTLHADYQMEWEGIMHGWGDAVTKIRKLLGKNK